jgi:LAO/AO transport system kinase
MQDHATDEGVFIRSMASRGHLGGLSAAVPQALRVLDAAGCDVVLVETVGVGQAEVEVASLADTTAVLLAPGMGDGIQAAKAGILEIADVFVVNKADRDGAPALMAELKFMAHLHASSSSAPHDIDWEIPVLSAQAQNDVGIEALLGEIKRHGEALRAAGALEARRRARRRAELQAQLAESFRAAIETRVREGDLAAIFDAVAAGTLDTYSAVAQVLGRVLS